MVRLGTFIFLAAATVALGALGVSTEVRAEKSAPRFDVLSRDESSLNWAGYAAVGGHYTSVSGTWTVPEIDEAGELSAHATWVGIGGITGSDLIQAGTAAIEDEWGGVEFFAWFETLPAAAVPVPLSVDPGDTITVHVREEEPSSWLISIINSTKQQEIHIPITYESSYSSAEWIHERPMVGDEEFTRLSSFDTVNFSDARTIVDGENLSALEAGAHRISMTTYGGDPLAVPSVLGAEGQSFFVSRTRVDSSESVRASVATADNSWLVVSVGNYTIELPFTLATIVPRVDLISHLAS